MCCLAANIYDSCCHRGLAGDYELLSTCLHSEKCLHETDPISFDKVVSKPGFCPACRKHAVQGHPLAKYKPPRICERDLSPSTPKSELWLSSKSPSKAIPRHKTPEPLPMFRSRKRPAEDLLTDSRLRRRRTDRNGNSDGQYLTPRTSNLRVRSSDTAYTTVDERIPTKRPHESLSMPRTPSSSKYNSKRLCTPNTRRGDIRITSNGSPAPRHTRSMIFQDKALR